MAVWVKAHEPLLENIFGYVDGKNYRVSCVQLIDDVCALTNVLYIVGDAAKRF
ncbi:hypothetical protein PI125_g23619 [Phytophthora idaei]|nr:hypothetical protein PI125_g23619 [Phytophthora idaei]KAG3123965.1 hypothetical protein PI126_g23460 [Phytophthora idaei]